MIIKHNKILVLSCLCLASLVSNYLFCGTGFSKSTGLLKITEKSPPEGGFNNWGQFFVEESQSFILFSSEQLLQTRDYILNSSLNREEKVAKINCLYERSAHLFESADDYILLLTPPTPYSKATMVEGIEEFVSTYVDDFFELKPTLAQIIELETLVKEPLLAAKIWQFGLNLVRSPMDFMMLLGGAKNTTVFNKLTRSIFIRNNMHIYKQTQPTIDEVMSLHEYIIKIFEDRNTTIATLLKLKESFIKDFKGADLIRLLDYGVATPSSTYIRQMAAFKKQQGIEF